jgi:type I restriction enzyme S subunit
MNGWGEITVQDGLETIIDYRGKTPPKSESGVPLISAKNVKAGRVVFAKPEYISPADFERWTTRGLTRGGDVLITTEAPAGEVAPHPRSGTFQISRRVMALRADEKRLHNGYLLYALQSRPVQLELLGRNRGTTVPRVLKPDITGLVIPAPPFAEQRRIAAVLRALDDKIELNRKMNRTLEEMAQALFKSWFIDFDGHDDLVDSELGPIPKGWQICPIDDVIEVISGGTPKRSEATFWNGSIPWFSVKDAPSPSDIFVLSTERKITDKGLAGSAAKLVPEWTTIISARGTVGKLAVTPWPISHPGRSPHRSAPCVGSPARRCRCPAARSPMSPTPMPAWRPQPPAGSRERAGRGPMVWTPVRSMHGGSTLSGGRVARARGPSSASSSW